LTAHSDGCGFYRHGNQEHKAAAATTHDQVRALLRRLFDELRVLLADDGRRDETQTIEHIELEPATLTARLHYQIGGATGDKLATPRGFEPLLQP